MSIRLYLFIMGRMALLNAAALAIPLVCAMLWQENTELSYAMPLVVTLALGVFLERTGHVHKKQLGVAEGAVYLLSVWFLLGFIGMTPYILQGLLAPADAFFESISAYTTTGLSFLDYDVVPNSILLWRSMMEWMGGLNFIILVVTIIPQVSGGFGIVLSAHQSIAFSPMLTRMDNAAIQTGKVYIAITVLSFVLYFLAGLAPTDALAWSMDTVSTSGTLMSLDVVGNGNIFLELAAILSMIVASCNFLLIWKALARKRWLEIFRDHELRTFLGIIAVAGILISFHLWHTHTFDGLASLRYCFFAVISFIITTGLSSTQFTGWPEFDRYALFLLVFVGGCIGSATSGLRVMRIIVLFRMAIKEMQRTLHPQMVISLKIDNVPVPMRIISRVLSFFFLYMSVFFLSMLIISLSGVTLLQAMGLAAGCLSSVGSTAALYGLDAYATLPVWTKLYCSLVMILGRIEIFSFLVVIQTVISQFRSKW